VTSGAGLIYSDDGSCSWNGAGGVLSDVLPYAFTVAPTNSKRIYAIGVPRKDLRAGDGIYVSDDGGLTFREPAFTAPAGSALLTIAVVPSEPSTLLSSMFSTPENHPILLRSHDSGEHWEAAADLAAYLGDNPFELLAIDSADRDRVYARVLEPSAETLAISEDGGFTFSRSISIPGKLNAFLKLASGTILVGGIAGTEALGYRSRDGAYSFEPWPDAPHVHALAERAGKLYVAADDFADGYALAESDDDGVHLRPLGGFQHVRSVRSCVADACAERCTYYAGIQLWPAAVCEANLALASEGDIEERPTPRASRGHSSCALSERRSSDIWTGLWTLALMLSAARRVSRSSASACAADPISGG
jgi:hypothetical protein